MKQKMQVEWDGEMAFSTKINGHSVTVDASEEFGGKDSGPTPKPLMLIALAGCTGIDVVSILKKMKVDVDSFSIDVESTMSEDHPKVYTAMHITYTFSGNSLDTKKLKKAIDLSQDKYCGVSAMYKKAMDITYEMKVLDNQTTEQ